VAQGAPIAVKPTVEMKITRDKSVGRISNETNESREIKLPFGSHNIGTESKMANYPNYFATIAEEIKFKFFQKG
jgi:hypothetical protein